MALKGLLDSRTSHIMTLALSDIKGQNAVTSMTKCHQVCAKLGSVINDTVDVVSVIFGFMLINLLIHAFGLSISNGTVRAIILYILSNPLQTVLFLFKNYPLRTVIFVILLMMSLVRIVSLCIKFRRCTKNTPVKVVESELSLESLNVSIANVRSRYSYDL